MFELLFHIDNLVENHLHLCIYKFIDYMEYTTLYDL